MISGMVGSCRPRQKRAGVTIRFLVVLLETPVVLVGPERRVFVCKATLENFAGKVEETLETSADHAPSALHAPAKNPAPPLGGAGHTGRLITGLQRRMATGPGERWGRGPRTPQSRRPQATEAAEATVLQEA